LDDICSAVSEYLTGSDGLDAARRFWRAVDHDDRLHESAQTQLYLLANPSRSSLVVNGDFERGDLSGWDASESVTASPANGRRGTVAARMAEGKLSQSLALSPLARYWLTAWVRYTVKPKGYRWDKVPAEVTARFFSGSGTSELRQSEPLRAMLRSDAPEARWTKISVTMTAPPEAHRAVLTLQNRASFAGAVLWDDVSFKTIKPGPAVQEGHSKPITGGKANH